MASSSVESRLAALEARLGLYDDEGTTKIQSSGSSNDDDTNPPGGESADWGTRLDILQRQCQSLTTASKNELPTAEVWASLDPGTALTHQPTIAAPILYRRQEILAQQKALQSALAQVGGLASRLGIGAATTTTTTANNNKSPPPLTLEQVEQAPILVSTATPIPIPDRQRLAAVEASLEESRAALEPLTHRIDALVRNNMARWTIASEKLVLAQEQVGQKEEQKQ